MKAYLFVVAIEIPANKIRFEKGIKALKLRVKLNMLVDDRTLMLTDLVSIENVLNLLNQFTQCSGLKNNIDKTKAKNIGFTESPDTYPHG